MPFYPAADHDVQPAPALSAAACRCCPGGISRGTRRRRYPSDMTEAEWAVCEPLLPARRGWPGAAAAPPPGACATSSTRSATSPTTGRCGGRCRPIPARGNGLLVDG